MLYWPLLTEIIALLLICVLLLSLTSYNKPINHSLKMYWFCLVFSGLSIILNIVCTILLDYPGQVPVLINLFLNSIYFLLVVVLCSTIAMYIFEKMLEHVYEQYCITRVRIMLVSLTGIYALLVAVNLKAGILFWFDQDGQYHRGTLNWSGYAVMAIEMAFLVYCFIRHRSSVAKEMKHALKIILPLSIALMIIQVIEKRLLLNGTIAALVDIVLFISFFSYRREEDSVTGIGNRDGFFSELSLRLAGKQKFQILLLFTRDFASINQRYGYQTGNEFLYSIALWIENNFKEAVAFRYIGVTFAVILPYPDEGQKDNFVYKLEERAKEPWVVGKSCEVLTPAIASYVYNGENIEEDHIMEILDYMLSIVKRSGKKYVEYDEKAAVDFHRRRRTMDCLRRAIQERLFEVWYQPVYAPERGEFVSAEALVRLRDDKGRMIPPGRFIPVAEEMGNVGEVFWQVLTQVCCFISDHKQIPIDTVSVNISLEQFEDPHLPEKIRAVLEMWNVEPEKLRLEITERAISGDAYQSREIIRIMEEDGFRFYLDDFGTGYSNFATLAQYHFECIKLDKSLIGIVDADQKGYNMVRGLIRLIHELGIKVIAEGTETKEQVDKLLELGADKIQGFYYARPMDGEELSKLLSRDTAACNNKEEVP